MSGNSQAQHCPHCGEQPMSRIRYLLLPGTRATCTRCGRRIRVNVSRVTMLALVAFGALMGALIVWLTNSWTDLAVGLGCALLVAFALDQWAWRRLPWVSDEPAAPAAPAQPSLETAGR